MATENTAEAAFRQMLKDMRGLFWDTDPEALDMDRHRRYIISRLLNLGGMPGIIWVMDHYTEDEIIDAVLHRRDMDPKVRSFMCNLYGISEEKRVAPEHKWR